jgi:hypothetical protein
MYIEIKNKHFVFVSDILDDENMLQQQIYKMKDKIVEVLNEIDELKANEIIEIMENKDLYFSEIKVDLEQRLESLKSEKSYLDINIMKYKEMKS